MYVCMYVCMYVWLHHCASLPKLGGSADSKREWPHQWPSLFNELTSLSQHR